MGAPRPKGVPARRAGRPFGRDCLGGTPPPVNRPGRRRRIASSKSPSGTGKHIPRPPLPVEGPGRDLERESDRMPEGMKAVPTGDRFGHRLTMQSASRFPLREPLLLGAVPSGTSLFFSPPWRPYKQLEGKRGSKHSSKSPSGPISALEVVYGYPSIVLIGPGTAISRRPRPRTVPFRNLLTKLEG